MPCGFSKQIIPLLICQKDNGQLAIETVSQADDEVIDNGYLKCPVCGSRYEICNGILMMMDNQDEVDNVLKSEINARDKEAGTYDLRLASRYDKEIPSTLKSIGSLEGKTVIEYACGTGRISTLLIPSASKYLAVDFSLKSLVILSEKLGDLKNIGLVWGDAIQFKTGNDYFDIALSFQFYEHIPDRESRSNFLNNASTALKTNGAFISTLYHYDLRKQWKKIPQEGVHSSGIHYYYFSKQEIANEIGKYFQIEDLRSIDITLPFEARLHLPRALAGKLSRVCETIPYLCDFGHLILVRAKKYE